MVTVCEISRTSEDWRYLIEHSHQTSLYVLPEWLALHDVGLLGAYKGNNIHGGAVVVPFRNPLPYVPYQGLLQFHKEDHEVAAALIEGAEGFGRPLSIWNGPSLVDIRPFTWRFWDAKILWNPTVRYTYICDRSSELENRARALVTQKPVEEEAGMEWFEGWKEQAWVGQNDIDQMEQIVGFESTKVYSDEDATVVWGVDLQNRGYYLASVGKPTNVIAHLIKQHPSSDMVGANSPERAKFKRSFGGLLRTYYGMVTV